MVPGIGKQSITIGSAPDCDIHLQRPGVAPIHARIVHQGGGQLVFVDAGAGPSSAGGQPLASGASAAFDFRTPFQVAGVTVPLVHPAITAMLMAQGQLPPDKTKIVLGRDAQRCHVVLQHPNVSGLHATINVNPLSITDNGSTSGTWLGQRRLPANETTALDANSLLVLGPIPLPGALLTQLVQAVSGAGGFQTAVAQAFTPPGAAGTPPSTGAPGSGGTPGSSGRKHKTVLGQISMSDSATSAQTIGRTKENDIQIDHPQVSSRHAFLHRISGKLFIEDRGSANGTYVRGQRIAAGQKIPVSAGEKVFFGPMPLLLHAEDAKGEVAVVIEDHVDWAGRPLYEIEAWDLVLQVPDRDNPNTLKTLLDHVSFKAMPGDFIALMGPSGAGKTTLLLTLNGYLPPSGGQVRINGEDLYSIYDALRGSIGYVPQDDIVHPELTVWEAVRYSARFRLPPDYADDEIDRRVETTLRQLGLEGVKHLQIGKPEKKVLSGGQRKRVNIAMELVTDPVIMFLDEPTSGLAADDTTALVGLLAELARTTGKTIITTIHQPAKDEFQKFNLCLIMGAGGIPIFYGPTHPDAYRFFGTQLERHGKPNVIDNPRDMFDMINQREKEIHDAELRQDPNAPRFASRQKAARAWGAEFFQQNNATFQKMFTGKRAVGSGTQAHALPNGRPPTTGQFGLLLSRYSKIKFRDVAGTMIMLLQAPIIGVLLWGVFGWQKQAIPFWCLGALQELSKKSNENPMADGTADLLRNMQTTPDHAPAIFFLVVAAVWFGTSNAAREIVSERAIYLRERMVNLGLFNYIFSKFLFLGVICAFQCAILLAIVFFGLGFHGGIMAFLISLGTLIVTAMNSAALGLLLSTVVESSEAAMALTPIALIPQVVLGGLMVPMTTNALLEIPMLFMPARWGFQGVVAQERMAITSDPAWVIDLKKPTLTSLDNFIDAGHFKCAQAQIASDSLNGAWGFTAYEQAYLPASVLGGMMLVTLLFTLFILKRRDRI
jgi:ABC-type multidrug transport system ATPase subunit/pSer/pThr/pTyr-binding forkhead associated (FHA) protein